MRRPFRMPYLSSLPEAFGPPLDWLKDRLSTAGPRAYADTHDVALSLMAGAPPCRVIDLGAGRGNLSTRMQALGHDVTAVERYTAQFRGDVPLIEADLEKPLPFADGSADIAAAVEIIEHLENPRAFLRELARVVRRRGIAIVSTPNLTGALSRLLFLSVGQWDLFFDHPWRLRDPHSDLVHGHITPLPRWLLEHHAKDAGFVLEAWGYSRAWLPGVPWRLNPLPRGRTFGRIALCRLRRT